MLNVFLMNDCFSYLKGRGRNKDLPFPTLFSRGLGQSEVGEPSGRSQEHHLKFPIGVIGAQALRPPLAVFPGESELNQTWSRWNLI